LKRLQISTGGQMKAVVYNMPKLVRVENVEDPKIEQPTDVIIRVTSTSICGSDLHIYNGLFPQFSKLVLGHEFMGIIEEVGSDVKNFTRGDRVIVPFPIGCGSCWFCRQGLTTQCENSNPDHYGPQGDVLKQKGGGLYGYTDLYGGYKGGQAQYARALYADFNLRRVPDGLKDEQVIFLTDIFPTGWTAVDWAEPKGGETVAVFGCGPVGIMAQKSAWLRGAKQVIGVDILPYRLDIAQRVAGSEVINAAENNVIEVIRSKTDGRGADICIDAVGMEAHRTILDKAIAAVHLERGTIDVLETAVSAARRGGTLVAVGVYATSYDNFPLGQIFDKGLSFRSGQALVHRYIDDLIQLVKDEKVRLDDVITHVMPLEEAPNAYDIFNKKEDNCLKVVLKP
jgi:S-(hydroxymethyl)glutathione dehydrogenase / alcohol dehydrogenase